MLLTVLMRWPALIAVLAIGGGGLYAYKEYGLPDSIELALNEMQGKPISQIKVPTISDSDKAKVVDHLAEATAPSVVVAASTPASAPVIATLPPVIVVKPESRRDVSIVEKYIVVDGDSLSKIAMQRTSNVAAQKDLVNRMFADNSTAFKDNDPNRLLAGVKLNILVNP